MMTKALAKAFDWTLGALWRLYVRMIVDGIFVSDHDLEFSDWAFAIVATTLLICAIPVAFILLYLLAMAAIDFPLQATCIIVGITAICILPVLALKSYKRSKAKAIAASIASSRPKAPKKTRKTKNAFNQ